MLLKKIRMAAAMAMTPFFSIASDVCADGFISPDITTTTTTTVVAPDGTVTKTVTTSETTSEKVDYMPKIHGVVRTRYEGSWDPSWVQRFQVRNARVSVEGNVLQNLSYFIRVDVCDRGKFKFLDAYANWGFLRSWKLQAGQFRVPFGVACFRGPGTYIFANRTYLVKYMANIRQVGARIGWYGTPGIPLTIEAGVFNSKPNGDHSVWQNSMDFAAKAVWKIKNVSLSASYLSMKPYAVRTNHVDAAVVWQTGRWYVEGEYQHESYADGAFDATHGWEALASYTLPLNSKTFNFLSFQGRYDGINDYSTGAKNDEGRLTVNTCAQQRITLGASLGFLQKPVKALVRLNFEKVFSDESVDHGDRIVAELVVKF